MREWSPTVSPRAELLTFGGEGGSTCNITNSPDHGDTGYGSPSDTCVSSRPSSSSGFGRTLMIPQPVHAGYGSGMQVDVAFSRPATLKLSVRRVFLVFHGRLDCPILAALGEDPLERAELCAGCVFRSGTLRWSRLLNRIWWITARFRWLIPSLYVCRSGHSETFHRQTSYSRQRRRPPNSSKQRAIRCHQ